MGTVDDFYPETYVPFEEAVVKLRAQPGLTVSAPERALFVGGTDLEVEDADGCGVRIYRLTREMVDSTYAYHKDLADEVELREGGLAFFKFWGARLRSEESRRRARRFAVSMGDVLGCEIRTEFGCRVLVPALWSVEYYFGFLPVEEWTDRELAAGEEELPDLIRRTRALRAPRSEKWKSILLSIQAEIARRKGRS